jgi:hypothetical protein
MPVNSQTCRYMGEKQIESFNRCEALIERAWPIIAATVANDSQRPDLKRPDLDLVRKRMEEDRIRIGFLGPSQVGKSFTVANVLGVQKKDSPAPEGGCGEAFTSAPTRIRVLPPLATGTSCSHAVRLIYMTKAEFRRRVEAILQSDLLRPITVSYCEPLQTLLDTLLEANRQTPVYSGGQDTFHHLIRLVRSAIRFNEVLKEREKDRVLLNGDFARRAEYVTDANPQSETNQYLLLREVQIDFRLPINAATIDGSHFPEDLELLDLPGLGTLRAADDAVTKDFLPSLQGAFMFQHSIQLTDANSGTLLNLLQDQYQSGLSGRIWYVVTKMDMLNDKAVSGDANIFKSILNRVMTYRLRVEDNVILVGNENYQERLRDGRVGRTPGGPADHGWQRDAQGNPEPIESMRQPPELARLYQYVLTDGGIPHLVDVINKRVRQAVQNEMRGQVDRDLKKLVVGLKVRLEAAAARAQMPIASILVCAGWEAEFGRLRERLVGGDFDFVEKPARQLRRELDALVDQLVGGLNIPASEMRRRHVALAGMLLHSAIETSAFGVSGSVPLVQHAFEPVRTLVKQIQLGPIGTGPIPRPADKCLELLDGRFAKSKEWLRNVFGNFESDFPGIDAIERTETYRGIMKRKVAAVSRAFGMRLLAEVNAVIRSVESELRALAGDVNKINVVDKSEVDRLLVEAESLVSSL